MIPIIETMLMVIAIDVFIVVLLYNEQVLTSSLFCVFGFVLLLYNGTFKVNGLNV